MGIARRIELRLIALQEELKRVELRLVDLQDNRDPGSSGSERWDALMAAVDDLRTAITDYIAKVEAAFGRLQASVAAIQAQLDSDEASDAAAIQPLLDQVRVASEAVPAAPVVEPPA